MPDMGRKPKTASPKTYLRCRIFARMRRFLRPTLRRPFPRRLAPIRDPPEKSCRKRPASAEVRIIEGGNRPARQRKNVPRAGAIFAMHYLLAWHGWVLDPRPL